MLSSLLFSSAILAVQFEAECRAIVSKAQSEGLAWEVSFPPFESGQWTFDRKGGELAGSVWFSSRSLPFNYFAATYGPSFIEAETPFARPVSFTVSGDFWRQHDIEPLLDWCRRNPKADLAELDPRLWVVMYSGTEAQSDEAVRMLADLYFHHKYSPGLDQLLKQCVRNGRGDVDLVLRQSEKMLWRLPRKAADNLASTMSREYPGWRDELKSQWPLNPDEPWDETGWGDGRG